MFNLISRLLPLHALLVILFAFGAAEPARAQLTFPTPTKTLCVGDPVVTAPTTCTPASPPNSAPLGQMVFYSVTLTPNATGNVTLLETLPPASEFQLYRRVLHRRRIERVHPAPHHGDVGIVTTLGTLNNLQAGQTVICFIRGMFIHAGATVTNTVAIGNPTRTPVSNPATYTVFVKANNKF